MSLELFHTAAPQSLHAGSWADIDESTRWRFCIGLGVSVFPLAIVEKVGGLLVSANVVQGAQDARPVFNENTAIETPSRIVVTHLDKKLPQAPVAAASSLWSELLPYPFSQYVPVDSKTAGDSRTELEFFPARLRTLVEHAFRSVQNLESQLSKQELSILVLRSSGDPEFLAFQYVRGKRVRAGLLVGDAKAWAMKMVVHPESRDAIALPRGYFFDTPKSESWGSTDSHLPNF